MGIESVGADRRVWGHGSRVKGKGGRSKGRRVGGSVHIVGSKQETEATEAGFDQVVRVGTEGMWMDRGLVEGPRGCGGTERLWRDRGLVEGPRACGGTERLSG